MYSPVHATVGLFIVAAIPDPAVGVPAAIASHYLLDSIPHGDTGLGPWMTSTGKKHRIITVEGIDLGTASLMVWFLIFMNPEQPAWYLLIGAVGGILPDLLWGLRFIIDKNGWFRRSRSPAKRESGSRPAFHAASGLSRLLHVHDQLHGWGHVKPADDIPFRTGLLAQGLLLAAVLLLYR